MHVMLWKKTRFLSFRDIFPVCLSVFQSFHRWFAFISVTERHMLSKFHVQCRYIILQLCVRKTLKHVRSFIWLHYIFSLTICQLSGIRQTDKLCKNASTQAPYHTLVNNHIFKEHPTHRLHNHVLGWSRFRGFFL